MIATEMVPKLLQRISYTIQIHNLKNIYILKIIHYKLLQVL